VEATVVDVVDWMKGAEDEVDATEAEVAVDDVVD
jgi:hypothetical protein